MNVSGLTAKRRWIGAMALLCLATALGLWVFSEDPEHNALLAAVTRVGIVLAALWLALPKSGTNWAWEKAGPVLIVAVALIAFAGRAMKFALPVALVVGLVLVLLRPRSRRGP